MGGLECVITGLMDEFKPTFDRWGITREIFTGMIVGVSFLVALGCVTPVHEYNFQWFVIKYLLETSTFFRVDFMYLPYSKFT